MRLATVSRLVDLCVERLTLGKKIIRALICAIHVHMRTCVHAYVRMCVRACVRTYAYTHVRMCACTHMSTHMMFSHVSLPTQRSLRVATIPSRVAVPWFAACTYARGMYPCAHVRMYAHMSTRMMFSQREPSHACLCESRYRSLPLASDPFKKRTSLCVSLVLPRPHTIMGQKRINKFFWQNWRRFCIFSTTCADSGCQNVKTYVHTLLGIVGKGNQGLMWT